MHAFTYLDRKQQGTLQFPVEYYYVDNQHPKYHMPFHWHNEWELLRILQGNLLISLDDAQYSMTQGDILLIRSGTLHGAMPESCIYETLVFDLYGLFQKLDMVKPYLRPFYRMNYVPQCYFSVNQDPQICQCAELLMDAFRSSDPNGCCELETIAYLSQFFAWLFKNKRYHIQQKSDDFNSRRVDMIKSVLEYIENNYCSNISLSSLAQIAGMNPKYFCRVFRMLTHHSPVDYLNFYRVEQAAHLLESTENSVTSIGAECGFWESSYFTKVFRKYKGLTPKEYRKSVLGSKIIK